MESSQISPPTNLLVPLSSAVRGEKPGGRRIYLMRNAESCDRLGQAWRFGSFRDHGIYRQIDLNQPVKIVNRHPDAFKNDCPITQVGSLSAQLIGRGMAMKYCGIHTVYCSPALRCIQTAFSLLETAKTKIPPRICIEPGLMDPLMFYWQDQMPSFMKTSELINAGYAIDQDYEPLYSISQMSERLYQEKTVSDVRERISKVVSIFLARSKEKPDGGVLVVTHAPIIDIVMRSILDKKEYPKTIADLNRMGLFYPFCSVTTLEADPKTTEWNLMMDALPKLSYMHMSTTVEVPIFDLE
uniref:Protein UBASH3A-like protein n=1 Tax=Panagrolaimus sp. JU765 TaxID=591449 RepID=A0AC34QMC1_9BILA